MRIFSTSTLFIECARNLHAYNQLWFCLYLKVSRRSCNWMKLGIFLHVLAGGVTSPLSWLSLFLLYWDPISWPWDDDNIAWPVKLPYFVCGFSSHALNICVVQYKRYLMQILPWKGTQISPYCHELMTEHFHFYLLVSFCLIAPLVPFLWSFNLKKNCNATLSIITMDRWAEQREAFSATNCPGSSVLGIWLMNTLNRKK